MDYNKSQTNQSTQTQAPATQRFTPASSNGDSSNRSSKGKRLAALVSALLILSIFVGGVLYFALQNKDTESTVVSGIEAEKYQAVFMTNGQVYFGHLGKLESKYSELTDVYYLQVQQDVQPAADKTPTDQSQVSLTKLGNELHGPTDRMHIASDQILFWENLKDDSTVVKAIKEYKTKQE